VPRKAKLRSLWFSVFSVAAWPVRSHCHFAADFALFEGWGRLARLGRGSSETGAYGVL
jgi:hypothetical protein